jgi:hypothetical protein
MLHTIYLTVPCVSISFSHDRAAALEEAAEEAESRAAHADTVIAQLQRQIAHSDYFSAHPAAAEGGHPNGTQGEEEQEGGAVDDSHLYVDAPELQDSHEDRHHHDPASPHSHDGSQEGKTGGSTISTVSSVHASGASAATGNAFDGSVQPGGTEGSRRSSTRGGHSHRSHSEAGAAAGVLAPTTAGTPTRNKKRIHRGSKADAASARESVLTSPTRSSYQRTLATVEQFVPGAVQTGAGQTGAAGTVNLTAVSVSANGNGHAADPRLPWRPSSPHPTPAHVIAGYFAQPPDRSRSVSPHMLREGEASFNASRNHSTSKGGSRSGTPLRSIRPRKSDSFLHDTDSSRRKDTSLSPFRRSSPAAILRNSQQRLTQSAQSAHSGPQPTVYRELNQAKCSYCARNLLELWTQKFGHPAALHAGATGHAGAVKAAQTSDSGSSYSESGSEDRSGEEGHAPRAVRGTGKDKNHAVTAGSATKAQKSSARRTKSRASSKRSDGSKKAGRHDPHSEVSGSDEGSDTEVPPPPPPSVAETGGAAGPVHMTSGSMGESGKHSTAVFDSAGNSISYALGWAAEERSAAHQPQHSHQSEGGTGHKLSAHLLPVRINTKHHHSVSSHGSLHFPHGPMLRHSRDSVEELSAITEEGSQRTGQPSAAQRTTQRAAEPSDAANPNQATTPVVHAAGRGIAALGVSPPPNTPASTRHSQHPAPQRAQSPHLAPASRVADDGRSDRSHHTGQAQESHATNVVAESGDSDTRPDAPQGVNSSSETLGSFPVNVANTATSQHTAQLLQKLRARNVHPKPYLTSTDTKYATTAALAARCNGLIQEYNAVLMTLGNEMLVADSMKTDYKAEIHESVNLVAELQSRVTSLTAENTGLYETVTAVRAEGEAAALRHEQLVRSMQEELLQTRVENEDLVEEAEGLRTQLLDSVSHSFGPGATPHNARSLHGGSRSPVARGRDQHDQHGHQSQQQALLQDEHYREQVTELRERLCEVEELHAERLRHERQRVSELERVVERQADERAGAKGAAEQLRERVFELEATLAECRQQLTERLEATQTLQHQLARQQAHSAENADRKAHGQVAHSEAALRDAVQKAADQEELIKVQQQLLQQRDLQIQQLSESQRIQHQLSQTLQQQLVDLRRSIGARAAPAKSAEYEVSAEGGFRSNNFSMHSSCLLINTRHAYSFRQRKTDRRRRSSSSASSWMPPSGSWRS